MEDVNKRRQNFISLSELGCGHLKYSFRRVRLHMALANEEHHQKQEVMKLLYTVSCTVAEDLYVVGFLSPYCYRELRF